jgi:hypothetical protein
MPGTDFSDQNNERHPIRKNNIFQPLSETAMKATLAENGARPSRQFFSSEAAAQVKAEKDVLLNSLYFERRDRGLTHIGEHVEARNTQVMVRHQSQNGTHQRRKKE